jgi:hypothetical protein
MSGWYCFDTVSRAADPRTRHAGKQAAQKECDQRNRLIAESENDGKTRNPKQWYTVCYLDQEGEPVCEPFRDLVIHYHGWLNDLYSEIRSVLRGGIAGEYIRDARSAVVWRGRLTQSGALRDPGPLPIVRLSVNGQIEMEN